MASRSFRSACRAATLPFVPGRKPRRPGRAPTAAIAARAASIVSSAARPSDLCGIRFSYILPNPATLPSISILPNVPFFIRLSFSSTEEELSCSFLSNEKIRNDPVLLQLFSRRARFLIGSLENRIGCRPHHIGFSAHQIGFPAHQVSLPTDQVASPAHQAGWLAKLVRSTAKGIDSPANEVDASV